MSWQRRDKNPLLKSSHLIFIEEEIREVVRFSQRHTASFCPPGAKFLKASWRAQPHLLAFINEAATAPLAPVPPWTVDIGSEEWLTSFVFSASVWRKWFAARPHWLSHLWGKS